MSTLKVRQQSTMSIFTQLDRKLPPVIESIRMDWITCSQSAAVVSAMLASVTAQLLSTFSVTTNTDYTGTRGAIAVFSYCALLFSCSATISSLLLIDEFGELPLRASRLIHPERENARIAENATELLLRYGARPVWKLVVYHWLICLVAGITCTIVEILLFAWLTLPPGIKIVLLLVGVFSILPLLFLVRLRRTETDTGLTGARLTVEPETFSPAQHTV